MTRTREDVKKYEEVSKELHKRRMEYVDKGDTKNTEYKFYQRCGFAVDKMIPMKTYKNENNTVQCRSCEREIEKGDSYCRYCGQRTEYYIMDI